MKYLQGKDWRQPDLERVSNFSAPPSVGLPLTHLCSYVPGDSPGTTPYLPFEQDFAVINQYIKSRPVEESCDQVPAALVVSGLPSAL